MVDFLALAKALPSLPYALKDGVLDTLETYVANERTGIAANMATPIIDAVRRVTHTPDLDNIGNVVPNLESYLATQAVRGLAAVLGNVHHDAGTSHVNTDDLADAIYAVAHDPGNAFTLDD